MPPHLGPIVRTALVGVLLHSASLHAQGVTADWTGTWTGTLVNLPTRAGAPVVTVRREIGVLPTAPGECATFLTVYSESGVERGRKDFRLCRRAAPDSYVIDEGDGIELPARWLGDLLIAPFKYARILLVSTTRVSGDEMVEEIFTMDDAPATEGVVGLEAKGVQRLELRRVRGP